MEHVLPYILVLACPVSMGAMMWFMMRDKHDSGDDLGELKRRIQELETGMGVPNDPPPSMQPVATQGTPKLDSR